jgi:hypothetical protein
MLIFNTKYMCSAMHSIHMAEWVLYDIEAVLYSHGSSTEWGSNMKYCNMNSVCET